MAILFYSNSDEYYWLSNFSPHGFSLDGHYWPTVEHYFQAQKFPGSEYQTTIRKCHSPSKAKSLGRSRKHPLRKDWEAVKDGIMKNAVRAKFRAHADVKELLLATGDEKLVENAPNDSYWGCGRTGAGKNRLGQIIMQVREELRAEVAQQDQTA